jgi:RpiB/LacA/LacB family sugar-phosphate isomerase
MAKKVLVIGCDHAGVRLKKKLIENLKHGMDLGLEILDVGCHSEDSVDYPLYATEVCETILRGEATHGLLICGTGVGMSMVANRFQNIRAVLANDVGVVKLAREHNNANVLCLGGRIGCSEYQARLIVDTFLNTEFSMNGRHRRRIEQMENAGTTAPTNAADAGSSSVGQILSRCCG